MSDSYMFYMSSITCNFFFLKTLCSYFDRCSTITITYQSISQLSLSTTENRLAISMHRVQQSLWKMRNYNMLKWQPQQQHHQQITTTDTTASLTSCMNVKKSGGRGLLLRPITLQQVVPVNQAGEGRGPHRLFTRCHLRMLARTCSTKATHAAMTSVPGTGTQPQWKWATKMF